MKTLIIGAGEVGSSLKLILEKTHETLIRDIEPVDIGAGNIEVIHICYPDSDKFIDITKSYIDQYKPKLTIIHSSVRVGTTKKVGNDIVYSPIRGRHPGNGLQKEIPAYLHLIACEDREKIKIACEYFRYTLMPVGWPISHDTSDLEFCKLISNVHMGLEIAWRQEVERMMNELKICKAVYEGWESSYASGLIRLSQDHLVRSRMNPEPIGGHCILPCTEILSKQFPSKVFDFIMESNEKAKAAAIPKDC